MKASKVILSLYSFWTFFVTLTDGKGVQFVSCGSVVKLYNSYFEIRLHSHDIKYGSGSGQQSVTGTKVQEDHNSNWLIKGNTSMQCNRGEAVDCGQAIRLEHLSTKSNLHSHLFRSPLSDQQEISSFGSDGEGDTGDNWQVVCDGQYWIRNEPVKFKHVDTHMYLGATGNQFGRPINGQKEIVGTTKMGPQCKWETKEGIFVEPSETLTKYHVSNEHTEL